MVQDGAAVPLPLGVIHKGPNVLLLAMVTDSWADHHGDITWDTQTKKQEMIWRGDNVQQSLTHDLNQGFIDGPKILF